MKKYVMTVVLLFCVILAGCTSKEQSQESSQLENSPETKETIDNSQPESETQITSEQTRSYLTGMLVDTDIAKHRPVAVMFNNIVDAIPQSGIENADILYEVPVEGGITRLMGIIEDYQDLDKIGSVRSSRAYFIYFAREFDAVYVHFGQNDYALPLLDLEDTHNLNGMENFTADVFYRTSDRQAPHNAYTSGTGIEAGIAEKGYRTEYDSEYTGHYKFASDDNPVTLNDGVSAQIVYPGYTVNRPWFEYQAEDGLYYRYQYGDKQIDQETGNQLTYTNIIFQYVDWNYYEDGSGVLDIDTESGGAGMFLTGGKAVNITWEKISQWGVTHYYNEQGEEITLNQGKTWVCVIQNSNVSDIVLE